MSGIVGVGLGVYGVFGPGPMKKPFWVACGAAFALAVFDAFRRENAGRMTAEIALTSERDRSPRPRILPDYTVQYQANFDPPERAFRVVNAGQEDAFDVEFESVTVGDLSVSFERVARIPAGSGADIKIGIVEPDGSAQLEPDLGGAIDRAWWGGLYRHRGRRPARLSWPLITSYRDFGGHRYKTTCQLEIDTTGRRISWRLVADQRLLPV